MLNGVLHDRLQGKSRQLMMRQPFRHRHLDLQVSLKASLLNLQIGVNMLDLIGKSDNFRRPFQVLAKEGRQILHQLAGLIAVAADHRLQRVKRVKQEVRVDLGVQELDFGLRQQRLLPLVLSGEDLRRQQLGNPSPRVRLIELNRRFFASYSLMVPITRWFSPRRGITSVDPSLQCG